MFWLLARREDMKSSTSVLSCILLATSLKVLKHLDRWIQTDSCFSYSFPSASPELLEECSGSLLISEVLKLLWLELLKRLSPILSAILPWKSNTESRIVSPKVFLASLLDVRWPVSETTSSCPIFRLLLLAARSFYSFLQILDVLLDWRLMSNELLFCMLLLRWSTDCWSIYLRLSSIRIDLLSLASLFDSQEDDDFSKLLMSWLEIFNFESSKLLSELLMCSFSLIEPNFTPYIFYCWMIDSLTDLRWL